jgi:hypothetical protein
VFWWNQELDGCCNFQFCISNLHSWCHESNLVNHWLKGFPTFQYAKFVMKPSSIVLWNITTWINHMCSWILPLDEPKISCPKSFYFHIHLFNLTVCIGLQLCILCSPVCFTMSVSVWGSMRAYAVQWTKILVYMVQLCSWILLFGYWALFCRIDVHLFFFQWLVWYSYPT